MSRFILTAAAIAFTTLLTCGTDSQAKPGSHTPAMHKSHTPANHNHVRSNFHDRGFRGWNSYCWFPRYRCYGYYCTTDQCWFYWYQPFNQYLPISMMGTYPPTAFGQPQVGMGPGAPGMLPPGATQLPNGTTSAPLPPSEPVPAPVTPPAPAPEQ